MAIWLGVALVLVLGILPFGMGNALLGGKNLSLTMLCGLFASFCVFEALAVPFHATLGSLRLMTVLWCVICGTMALWGLWKFRYGVRPERSSMERWTRTQKLLLVVAIAFILLQVLNTLLNTYYGNWDDETYCGTAAASWYTDTVDRYGPNSGVLQPAFYNEKYNIAAWPVYSSMLAVLTGVHPVILFRTVLPVFEIPLAYYIAYLLLRFFWPKARGKALLGLVYYVLFTLLVAENMPQTSGEWWMVVNIWTGKALTNAIMIPLILWLLVRLDQCRQDTVAQRTLWKVLLPVCWASCFISASLFFVVPVELLLWGGFYLIRTRRWADISKFVICGLPTAICALVTLF